MNTTILDELKRFTYCVCYECTSVHTMEHTFHLCCELSGEGYQCEECYREIMFEGRFKENEEFRVEWAQLEKYILAHVMPKKAIRVFIKQILNETCTKEDLTNMWNELFTTGTFMTDHPLRKKYD